LFILYRTCFNIRAGGAGRRKRVGNARLSSFMDFHGVVSIVKDFYINSENQEGKCPLGGDVIYGRICGTNGGFPEWLSSDREKRTVFLFGPDAIKYVMTLPAPELLYKLGADKQYLHHQASTCWSVLECVWME